MKSVKIIFFGSTSDSVIVLSRLHHLEIGDWILDISSVVTQPPRAVGRKQIITPTPVDKWATSHKIPVLSFSSDPDKPWLYTDENTVIDALEPFQTDLIVSACYGQKIPEKTITDARFGGLNVHPSLLPRWRGADPVPWAIYTGDHQTGVTVVTLSENFDTGAIIARKAVPILPTDTSDALRTKLFTLGAELLIHIVPDYLVHTKPISPSLPLPLSPSPYARRLTRDDGYEPWEAIQQAVSDPIEAERLDRKFRAFHPWPGVWTLLRRSVAKAAMARRRQGYGGQAEEKRLKILACHLDSSTHHLVLDTVQREGKKPVSWTQFQTAYLPS